MTAALRPYHWMVVTAAALLVACHAPPSGLLPIEQPAAVQPATPRINGTIPPNLSGQHPFESRGVAPTDRAAAGGAVPAAASSAAAAGVTAEAGGVTAEAGGVTLNFLDTDIREIARAILGTTLKLNYTIDPRVHGTASISTGTPLPRSDLLPTLETLLNQNGATLVERNGIYDILPIAAGMTTHQFSGTSGIGAGVEVVQLRYTSAADLAKVLEPYVGEGGKIAPDAASNALVVSGDQPVRETLVGLIRAFDTDLLAGRSYALYPAGDSDPQKLATEFQTVLQAQSQGPLSQIVSVLPMERVNAVLVVSSQPRYIDAADRFFGLATRVENATARTWHVYYVQNGQANDLAYTLQSAFTPNNVTAQPSPAPGSTTPSAQPLSMGTSTLGGGTGGGFGGGLGTSGGFGAGVSGGGTPTGLQGLTGGSPGTTGAAPGGATTTSASAQSAATEPLSATSEGGAGAETRMRIIPNPVNNALLIYATAAEYSVIEAMLRKIDIIPLQVLIEATIAEVDLNNALQYGVQFFFKTDHFAETLGAPSSGVNSLSTPQLSNLSYPSTSPYFVLSKSPNFALSALADVTKVKVLSAPQVMVLDNQPASLQVGQQVPVLTGTSTSTITGVTNSVNYVETGVIMQVTPRVNTGGLVTLDIAQEVSDVASAAANTVTGSPTFNDQVFRTQVAVEDGQTVGMAGLIQDNASVDNTGIPVLKDIPLLGTLFSTQTNSRDRTELLVLITPHVVHDQRDARALTEDMRNSLSNAALAPQQLQHENNYGSANPNGF
jgi:general secretion pathway protein D